MHEMARVENHRRAAPVGGVVCPVLGPGPGPRGGPRTLQRVLVVSAPARRAQFELAYAHACRGVFPSLQGHSANVENLLVHLFTGPGLHPTGGIVVPGSGAAGGAALNLEWNEKAPLYERFTTNLEVRRSENGFWAVGAKLQALLSDLLEEGKSSQFTFGTKHFDLPRLPFYGLGNGSSLASRAFYGLTETEISANLDVPVPFGVTLSGELDGLWFAPDPSAVFDTLFNEASAPGLHAETTYIRPGLSAAWKYPRDDTLYGFSTSANSSRCSSI